MQCLPNSGTPNSVTVPAQNLRAQYQAIRGEVEPVLLGLFESQMLVLGPEVEKLEAELAQYCGAARGIGCASGTDALILPLIALGIGSGDEVITSPYSFFATAGSIWRTGAKPVFVDIQPDTYNIDPAMIEAAITPRTRMIMPVHLYGQTADMDPIKAIAQKHDLFVLEDAAQAIGADYKGRRAGSLGDAGALSFYPSKNLGGFGDGGMMLTDDAVLGRSVARLRVHGMEPKYHHHEVGFNSRLDAIQAAVLRVKLRHLEAWTLARREAAALYDSLFEAHRLTEVVIPPCERDGNFHVFNQYVVRVPANLRDALREYLASRQIGTEIYYPIPLHLQPCFEQLGYAKGDFPHAESAARQTIALPVYPELTDEQQRFVVGSIRQFLDANAPARATADRAA
jgi:dTDP-4-amino-4,6-dideoxygalactose transaminase